MKRTELKRKSPMKPTGGPKRSPVKRKAKSKSKSKASTGKRWRSPEYLTWIRARPCVVCGAVGNVAAHHLKGVLHASGGGLKAPDSLAMPACDPFFGGWNNCHAKIHNEKELREQQPVWLIGTLTSGLEVFEGETREELARALAFVRERV